MNINIKELRACLKFSRLSQKTPIIEDRSAACALICEQRTGKNRRFMASIGDFKQALKKCYLVLPILCLPMLQGCIPLAIGAVVGGGLVAYKKPHFDTVSQDSIIYRKADRALDNLGRDSHVVLAVSNNNVLLVGQVPSEEQKARVESLVKNVPYVKRVYNQLTVGPVTTGLIRSNDSWITTKVKTELIGTKGLDSVRIKIVTENGVVYLMGITSQEQAEMAVNATRRIVGVQKVVKLFEYT